jgi:hypothetical protein
MPTMTKTQYDAGLDAICDRLERIEAPTATDLTACNEALEKFKATARIVPAQRTSQPRPAAETTARPATRAPARAASAKPAKGAKRAARIAKAVSESLTAAHAAARRPVPQAPVRELHEMSTDELAETAAAAYRAVGESQSPFWEAETPGVQQGPAGSVGPRVNVIPVPPPDQLPVLSDMSSEDWERASGQWFLAASQARHPSPFWQAA